MLIGQDRSGKTSLKKSLKGQLSKTGEESTVGIDVDPSHFKVSTEIWKTGEKDQQTSLEAISYEHHAAQLIVGSLMEANQSPEKRSTAPIQKPLEPIQSGGSILASGDSSESNRASASKLLKTSNGRTGSKLPDVPRDVVFDPSEPDKQTAYNAPAR